VVGRPSLTETDLPTLVERGYRSAAQHGETVLRRSVAGHLVELRVAGQALADLLGKALPISEATGRPRLVVRAWDRGETGIPFPLPEDIVARLSGWRRHAPWSEVGTDGIRLMHQPFEKTLGILCDDVAYYWTDCAAELPYYEHSAPLLHLLHWWLESVGLHIVHAGAVGWPRGGALLVGPGGSGKSTSTLACLGSRLGVVADDYTVVGLDPAPRALALYRSAKLERGHDRELGTALPHLPPAVNPVPQPNDKALYFLDDLQPEVPLRAVLVPRVTGAPGHRIVPMARGRAFAALAPSTILQLPGAGARSLSAMRMLCDAVPVYALELGTDVAALPDVIETVCR
jgi:hypothetical protein